MQVLYYQSPIGILELASEGRFLKKIHFTDVKKRDETRNSVLEKTARQLDEYFHGERTGFDLPLAPEGTDFQKRVWNELGNIPYGATLTYRKLAERLGDEKTIRAAGRANGQNPIAIVIPCHRVIGMNGKLTGYAGGVERKRWLLQHEGAVLL